MILEELSKIGLNKNEVKVYLAALELGETTIARLSQKSEVKRSTVYLAIDSLKKQGLISLIKKGKKSFFIAEDPRKIEKKLEERKEAIARIMPELLSFSNVLDKKPKIRYFEGKEALKEIYNDILTYPDREICAWFPDQLYWLKESYFDDYFIPKRLEKNIWVRTIAPETKFNKKYLPLNEKQLRKMKLVSSEKYKIKVEIILYGKKKIGITSYKEELGLIIESEDMFEALQSIFDVMWDGLKGS